MKFNRKKRAISYIMEVVMMTLVVTALASVVLTWGISTITESRAALGGAVRARMDRVQEALVVQDVQMISTTSMRLWVRNTGSIQIVVDQAYVNNNLAPITGVCSPPNATPPCTGTGKLSLPIQAVGAVDVIVIANTIVATSGTATSGTTTTLTDTTKSWTTNQWANCAVTITAGTQSSPSSFKTIVSNTANQLVINLLSPWGGTGPDSTSQYSILGICSGATYTVIAATTRGTTFQGSFTV